MSYQPDQLIVATDATQLIEDVANNIVSYAQSCVDKHQQFNIALAGGSTPASLYQALTNKPMPWHACHFYFGDERMVAHDHLDSNYAMARRTLFDHAPIAADNIHPIPTDCDDPRQCAAQYAQQLDITQVMDLVLLGIGTDGHTASLFPDTDILDKTDSNAAACYVEKLGAWRISMTYPFINKSKQVIILIQGKGKREIVDAILNQEHTSQYPVTKVRPAGELIWHLDEAAIK